MAPQIRFILGLHCHQPVGNFHHVSERAYQESYEPFLSTFERFQGLRVVLHYSGPLLEWLSEHKPEFFSRVRRLVAQGRVELTGGGHYEPILPAIPQRDCLGQMRMMSCYIKKNFGVRVRGCWLTERIWEPHLPRLLAQAGMEFTTVDDFHFQSAGFDIDSLQGYYMCEDQDELIKIFPISRQLRYMVPYYKVDEVINFFRSQAERLPQGSVLTLADDGEKFGMWPGTHDWVYKQGWLEQFFTALQNQSSWLESTTFSRVADGCKPTGRVYLPSSSYLEMGTWSLPAASGERFQKLQARLQDSGLLQEAEPYLRGSFWRNFLIKYPEAGWMHARMRQASRRVARAVPPGAYGGAQGRLCSALRKLWMSQCNCAYWHGIFGGLYLPHLRHAVFTNLVQAEDMASRSAHWSRPLCQVADVDGDGHPEVELAGSGAALFIKPSRGGSIVELDHLDTGFNFCDTLARRQEAYHYKTRDDGTDQGESANHQSIHQRDFEQKVPAGDLATDPYPRHMLREHFFLQQPDDPKALALGQCADAAAFADARWQHRILPQRGSSVGIKLMRTSPIFLADNKTADIALEKTIRLGAEPGRVDVRHTIKNLSGQTLEVFFGVSFNLTVLGPADPNVGLLHQGSELSLDKPFVLHNPDNFTIFNRREGIYLSFQFRQRPEFTVQHPVYTVSQSESGIDRTYQATCLLPVWRLALQPGRTVRKALSFTLST